MELIQKLWMSHEDKRLLESKSVSKDLRKQVSLGTHFGNFARHSEVLLSTSSCLFGGRGHMRDGSLEQSVLSADWRVVTEIANQLKISSDFFL